MERSEGALDHRLRASLVQKLRADSRCACGLERGVRRIHGGDYFLFDCSGRRLCISIGNAAASLLRTELNRTGSPHVIVASAVLKCADIERPVRSWSRNQLTASAGTLPARVSGSRKSCSCRKNTATGAILRSGSPPTLWRSSRCRDDAHYPSRKPRSRDGKEKHDHRTGCWNHSSLQPAKNASNRFQSCNDKRSQRCSKPCQ